MLCGFDGVGMRRRGEPETRINWDFKRGEHFFKYRFSLPQDVLFAVSLSWLTYWKVVLGVC